MSALRVAPRAPRERLASLKSSGKPQPIASPRPKPVVKRNACPECGRTDRIRDIGDKTVCEACGTEISESNIVSEVTFGETAGGQAVVQGAFVGEGQRYAKSLGSGLRISGLGGTESREMTERNGRMAITSLANSLHIEKHIDRAVNIYKLALAINFTQGRTVPLVAAVCLYMCCREQPENKTLLMDFAEKISMNVFHVGETYKTLLKDLYIKEDQQLHMRQVEIEPLIERFARKLEFGDSTRKVCQDAIMILSRMKRDWMVSGRIPAGLCGACIILAARMNNFRRTVREVVYVVRVADITIAKRLDEFRRTRSGQLSVDHFREYAPRLKVQHDPPALYYAKEREEKKRQRTSQLEDEEPTTTSDDETQLSSRETSAAPPPRRQEPRQEPRRDADGFIIPDLPIDPSLLAASNMAHTELEASQQTTAQNEAGSPNEADASNQKSKSGKPPRKKRKKKEKPPPPVITPQDLMIEENLEEEIEEHLTDPKALAAMEEGLFMAMEAKAKALADELRGPSTAKTSEEIEDDEFDNDPEVANCKLSPEEVAIKERIWVTHNEDWLRKRQERILNKTLSEAKGEGKKNPRRKKKTGRMGDGSVLLGGTPVTSPAEANQRMLAKRGRGFSKHINYEMLNSAYQDDEDEDEEDETSQEGSKSKTKNSRNVTLSPSPSAASDVSQPTAGATGLPTPAATQVAAASKPQDNPVVVEDDGDEDESEDEEDEEEDGDVIDQALNGEYEEEEEYGDEYE